MAPRGWGRALGVGCTLLLALLAIGEGVWVGVLDIQPSAKYDNQGWGYAVLLAGVIIAAGLVMSTGRSGPRLGRRGGYVLIVGGLALIGVLTWWSIIIPQLAIALTWYWLSASRTPQRRVP